MDIQVGRRFSKLKNGTKAPKMRTEKYKETVKNLLSMTREATLDNGELDGLSYEMFKLGVDETIDFLETWFETNNIAKLKCRQVYDD